MKMMGSSHPLTWRTTLFALTVGITSMCVAFYYLFRKDDEEEEEDDDIGIGRSQMAVIEVSVPRDVVARFIGRNGENIKQLQSSCKARLRFKDDSGDPSSDEPRVLIIRGSSVHVREAELVVQKALCQMPPVFEEVITVPEWAIGRIIGKGGSTINQLCKNTGAKIKVNSEATVSAEIRQITIRGSKEQIDSAMSKIEEIVETESERRDKQKTSVRPRSLPTSRFPLNSWFNIFVTHVESMEYFWAQLIDSNARELDIFTDEITQFYLKYNQTGNRELSVGDLVATKYTDGDDAFYRGRLLSVNGEMAVVQYLDYGDKVDVEFKDLFPLESHFCSFPFQAVRCRLSGIRVTQNDLGSEPLECVKSLLRCAEWVPVKAKLEKQVGDVYELQVVTQEGVAVADELQQRGFVEKI